MPTLTVLAPDSALAMDEIARQLGDNAFILSTSQRDGMIEIKATNDPQPSAQRGVAAAARASFAAALSDAGGDEEFTVLQRSRTAPTRPTASPSTLGGVDAAPALSFAGGGGDLSRPSAAPVFPFGGRVMADPAAPGARPRASETVLSDFSTPDPRLAPPARARSAGASVHTLPLSGAAGAAGQPLRAADLDALHQEIHEIRQMLASVSGLMAPDGARAPRRTAPAPAGASSTIVAAGFSPDIETAMLSSASARDAAPADRPAHFAAHLAQRIVAQAPEAALDAQIIAVMGPSGAGRTTLAAKLAALVAEHRPERRCKLIEFAARGATLPNDLLRRHARLLEYSHTFDVACERWHEDDLVQSARLDPTITHIVDLPAFSDLEDRGPEILAGLERMGQTVRILALPGSLAATSIRVQLGRPEASGAHVALTKLDEGEITPTELSSLAMAGGRIGWLSGTRALAGNLSPATASIMNDYIAECLARA